ncbi:MAG: type II toxin-antitoxin system PemK/MazF family toxin [Bacteroidetes bacterium]|nr:type II toxin-antitoxin system PemK/MazF family toxin [Bacteroidota bacterium]
MKLKQFDIWTADLNPKRGTEPGKIRPVVIVQTNLLNNEHPSTLICPITTQVIEEAEILRVHLKKGQLPQKSDVLVDQIRAIDNRRFLKKVGSLNAGQVDRLRENLRVVMDL